MQRAAVRREALPLLLTCLGVVLLVLTSTSRLTLLDRDFDNRVVAKTNAYERIYTEVLPAPGTQKVIREALRDLPVDATYVTANLRLLVPPDVLEQVVNRALDGYVDYVLGDREALAVLHVLQPIIEHVVALVHDLAPGLVAAGRPITQQTLAGFGAAVDRMLGEVKAGELPLTLPDLPLPARLAPGVTALLTAALPLDSDLRPQVEAALAAGDLNTALALVVPSYLKDDPGLLERVKRNVTGLVDAARQPLSTETRSDTSLSLSRSVVPLGLRWLTVLGILSLGLALALLLRRRGSIWRSLALCLGASGVAALVTGRFVEGAVTDPLARLTRGSGLPPTAVGLVRDVDTELRAAVVGTYLRLVSVVLLAALACAVIAWARRSARRHSATHAAPSVAFAGLATVLLLGLAQAPAIPPATCNSAQQLCQRTYGEVTYLTSHNAMASSDEGFFSAGQDVDLVRQLDGGVRGLMLDLHYWTTPAEVQAYLTRLSPAARRSLAPLADSFAPRDGVWLCHVVCQLGARDAVSELKRVRDWLRGHRDAVVTLILEDHVTVEDVRGVLVNAGLDAFAATPPTGGAPWPTLGAMVRTGKRLVAFTERGDPDDGWLRNFYDYAAETPYQADSAATLSCRPARGPVTGSLFLLNNWVSTPAPSRAEAYAINRKAALLSRSQRCGKERGMHPTFVAVDFAQIGQPLDTVDRLNR